MKLENKIRRVLVELYWQAFNDGQVWHAKHADEFEVTSEIAKRWREKAILPPEKKILEAVKREVKKAAA